LSFKTAVIKFVRAEEGSITADWVVLSASVVGLGIAVLAAVTPGIGNLTSDIDTSMSEQVVVPAEPSSETAFDFSDGFASWGTAITSYTDPLISDALGPFYDQSGEEVLSNTFAFDPGTEFAVVEFDMTAIGKMERHDDFRVFVNGEMLDATSIRDGRIDGTLVNDHEAGRVAYQFMDHERISDDAAIQQRIETANTTAENGATTGRDALRSNVDRQSTYRMQVVVRNPTPETRIGFGRGGNSPYPGEGWSIDNMTVTPGDIMPEVPGP